MITLEKPRLKSRVEDYTTGDIVLIPNLTKYPVMLSFDETTTRYTRLISLVTGETWWTPIGSSWNDSIEVTNYLGRFKMETE